MEAQKKNGQYQVRLRNGSGNYVRVELRVWDDRTWDGEDPTFTLEGQANLLRRTITPTGNMAWEHLDGFGTAPTLQEPSDFHVYDCTVFKDNETMGRVYGWELQLHAFRGLPEDMATEMGDTLRLLRPIAKVAGERNLSYRYHCALRVWTEALQAKGYTQRE